MRLVLWCVLFTEILDKLCYGLVSAGQNILKKKEKWGHC